VNPRLTTRWPIPQRLFLLVLLLTLARAAQGAPLPLAAAADSVRPEPRHHNVESEAAPVAVPADTAWVRGLLLGIMWLFLAAGSLGLVASWFHTEPPAEADTHAASAGHHDH
jgi:hypothetical protein